MRAVALAIATLLTFVLGPGGLSPADAAPIVIHCPWTAGDYWQAGGDGSFYGEGYHTGSEYYAVDFNRRTADGGWLEDNNQPILAAADGTVTRSEWSDSYGNVVEISHANNCVTRYAHLNRRDVSYGQSVGHGEQIGLCGDTGWATSSHLHFALLQNGTSVPPDPMDGQSMSDGAILLSHNSAAGAPNVPILVAPGNNTHFIGHPFLDWMGGGGGSKKFQARMHSAEGWEYSREVTGTSWRPEKEHGPGEMLWTARAGNDAGWSAWAPEWTLWIYRPEGAFDAARTNGDPHSRWGWSITGDIPGGSVPSGGIWRIYPSGPDSRIEYGGGVHFYHGKLVQEGLRVSYEDPGGAAGEPYVQVDVEAANHTSTPWSKVRWRWGTMTGFDDNHAVPVYVDNTSPDVRVHHATCWFRPEIEGLEVHPVEGDPGENPFGDGAAHFDLKAIRFLRCVTWPKWEFDLPGNLKGWSSDAVDYDHTTGGGCWPLYFTGAAPRLTSPKLQIQGEDWGRLRLVMANHTSVGVARVCYKATDGGNWIQLGDDITTSTDGAFHTYEQPISVTGPIARICIDPVGEASVTEPGPHIELQSFELVEPDFTYTLVLSADPAEGGSIAVNGVNHDLPWSGEIAADAVMSLEALPADGYAFTGWSGGISGTVNPVTVDMVDDLAIAAHFTPVGPYRILSMPNIVVGLDDTPFVVPVQLDDASGVAGIEFTVAFDPAVVQCEDVLTADLTDGWLPVKNVDNVAGTCDVVIVSAEAIAAGSGPVAYVTFQPAAGAQDGDATVLELSDVALFDDVASPIPVLPQSGSLTLSAGGDPYDVDRDGDVNAGDAILLLQAAVGLPAPSGWAYDWPPLEYNDINHDGVINSADAILVLRHVVGLDASSLAAVGIASRRSAPGYRSDLPAKVVSFPSMTTGQQGGSVLLPLSIDDADGVAGMDFLIQFDPGTIQVVDVAAAEATAGLLLARNFDNEAGSIRVALAGTEACAPGTAVLLNVELQLVGSPASRCHLHFDVYSLYDADAQSIEVTAADGTVVVDFPDVPVGHWAHEAVNACAGADVVQGYPEGYYRPDESVSRDQMAVYISRASAGGDGEVQVPTWVAEPTFPDVPADHWAYRHIEYCAGADLVQGYPDGSYHPDEMVSRGQMAVYVARAVAGGDMAVPTGPAETTFSDVTADGDWAWCYRYVEYCASEGIVQGYWDGTYRPEDEVTRDQMAVYVQRAFDLPM